MTPQELATLRNLRRMISDAQLCEASSRNQKLRPEQISMAERRLPEHLRSAVDAVDTLLEESATQDNGGRPCPYGA